MGIADRDYHRQDRREGGGFFSQLTPVVKWLLVLNLVLYFVEPDDKPFRQFGAFTIQSGLFEGKIWQFITFQFLHGSVPHVLMNSIGIFFFGPWLERWWGSGKFLVFYLLCGAAGAVFFTLLTLIGILPGNGLESPLVGASAGIYGILIGVATIAPNLRVALLFPPIVLSIRQAAIGLLAIAVAVILLGYMGLNPLGLVDNEGGQAGHLGGAILGFFLMRFPWLLGGQGGLEMVRSKATAPRPLAKLRPRTELEMQQDTAMDLILDKISREGFQSLTPEEREFLQKASSKTKPS
jgi:membrane associated rhomboid family serine protease